MSHPRIYALKIDGETIDQEATSCTGKQMRELLAQVDPWVRACDWYMLDIKTNNSVDLLAVTGQNPQRLSGEKLREVCARVDQFLSGIFLAVPSSLSHPRLNLDAVTEDEPSLGLGDALLEIRAFDTSYFEVYTPLLALAQRLHDSFDIEFE